MQLARKYRPKLLVDLVGQPSVVQTLTNSFKTNKISQSYLFVGLFGSGKTSSARIVAAMENCEVSPGLTPCGKCSICAAIFEGSHTDIHEIDAASNAGNVEQVRKIKQNALYNPVDGAITKYFIIDEAHRASDAAKDALLKILEEPPSNVRFILCTTDANKLRPAIQSRCQRHDFRKIYWSLIVDRLEQVAKNEKVECDRIALTMCAKMAQGSMRNALQNLEKLINFANTTNIGVKDAQGLFGTIDDVFYYDLLDQIIGDEQQKPDATAGFKLINKTLVDGTDFDVIYDGIADHLRILMVALTCSKAADFIEVSEDNKRRLREQIVRCKSKNNSVLSIVKTLKNLHEAKMSVEYNMSTEIALQQWLVESVFSFRE